MSDAKFTQGEWDLIVSDDDFDDGELIVSMASHREDRGNYYCKHKIVISGSDGDDDEAKANAHLISAAPEMYKELKRLSDLMPFLDEQTHPQIECDALKYDIDKLLAKARGE